MGTNDLETVPSTLGASGLCHGQRVPQAGPCPPAWLSSCSREATGVCSECHEALGKVSGGRWQPVDGRAGGKGREERQVEDLCFLQAHRHGLQAAATTLVPQKSQPRKDQGHLSSQNRCSQQLCPFLAELALCSRKAGASALGTAVSA